MEHINVSKDDIVYSQKSSKKEKAEIALYFEVGAYDDEEIGGIAHFIEHMLVMGLNDWPIYSNNKIMVSATTDIFTTIYYIECKNTQIEINKALKVVELLVSGKTLNAFYMNLVREDVLKEYELYIPKIRNQTNYMLFNYLNLPSSLPIGELSIIKNIKFNDLAEFFNKYYKKCKKKMVIVGKYGKNDTVYNQIKKSIYQGNRKILWKKGEIDKYVFQKDGYLYLAWGNLLQLEYSVEKIEVIQIAFLIIVKKYYNNIIESFELYSYGNRNLFFLLEIRKEKLPCNESKLIEKLIKRLTDKNFSFAKEIYFCRRIRQKKKIRGELQDLLFSIKNNIQISDKGMIKAILRSYTYGEFMAIIKQVFNT